MPAFVLPVHARLLPADDVAGVTIAKLKAYRLVNSKGSAPTKSRPDFSRNSTASFWSDFKNDWIFIRQCRGQRR